MDDYMFIWDTVLWLIENEPEAKEEINVLLERLDELDREANRR